MSIVDNAVLLARAEEQLRALGLTGSQAFEALVEAIRARLGDDVDANAQALNAIEDVNFDAGMDLLGLAYERFFPDLFKGRKGQYFTPRPIVELVLARAGLRVGDRVLDPTCGSGGFLVCAAARGAQVRGIEIDPYLCELARLNLRMSGLQGSVERGDFFSTAPDPVDLVVANPPFSVEISDRSVLDRYTLGQGRRRVSSDWLFMEALERWVVPGGRAAVIVPWSVVVNPSAAPLRARIDEHWRREALCGLPEGVFRPFGGAAGRAFVLWLRRERPGKTMHWASVEDPGYDVRSRAVRATDSREVAQLAAGEGWAEVSADHWTPEVSTGGRRLADVGRLRSERVVPSKHPDVAFSSVDLKDSDRSTGEIHPVSVLGAQLVGPRVGIRAGDVLVARLRPNLGNVAIARTREDTDEPLVGSPEWIALEVPKAAHYALHALRSPTWREQLPVTGGQTHPRTTAAEVLASRVRWPDAELALRVDAISRELHEDRAKLRSRLDRLQGLVNRFVSGEIDEQELAMELDRLGD
jgi:protein-L-isoaspartate O-methyltransferase